MTLKTVALFNGWIKHKNLIIFQRVSENSPRKAGQATLIEDSFQGLPRFTFFMILWY